MMIRAKSVFALSLCAATALAACGRSESVDSFKPDRAEEKVAVTDLDPPKGTVAATPATLPAATGTLAPQDECSKDTSFAAYRAKLDAAVKSKNVTALKPLVDPNIKLDFGGGSGWETLATQLAEGPGGARSGQPLWAELGEILTLGCALDPAATLATMPFAFARLDTRDGFQTMIARRDTIALLKSADAKADTVKTLHWDVLTITAPSNAKDAFVAVKLDDGTSGFVRRTDARSMLDYRTLYNKGADGNWLMTAFIAGD